MSFQKSIFLMSLLSLTMLILTACGAGPGQTAPAYPNPSYPNPAYPNLGAIPPGQTYVDFTAADGSYSLQVPEGWPQKTSGPNVRIVNGYNGLSVTITSAASAPTTVSVVQNEVARLTRTGRSFRMGPITEMDLPGGHAIKISATVNSEPDPATGQQARLDEDIYIFYRNGTEAMLQLWSPQGSSNALVWESMAASFQWK